MNAKTAYDRSSLGSYNCVKINQIILFIIGLTLFINYTCTFQRQTTQQNSGTLPP